MMRGIQKLAELDSPLVAGGAVGLGTAALAHHMLGGPLAKREEALKKALSSYATIKSIPLVVGAVTALLVGSMVAARMSNKQQVPNLNIVPFTPREALFQRQGFLPGERTHVGLPQQYLDPVVPTF
jgi:hypothetical protein